MSYFPFFINVSDKNILIAGAGKTAFRKAEILLSFGCRLTVVSPEIKENFSIFEKTYPNSVTIINRQFRDTDIDGVFVVIAATDNPDVNSRISALCMERNIPVNVVDCPDLCTFIFPSIVKQDDLVCGISSGGKSPVITQYIKDLINNNIPSFLGSINNRMGSLREYIKEHIQPKKRKDKMNELFKILMLNRNNITDEELFEIINSEKDKQDD